MDSIAILFGGLSWALFGFVILVVVKCLPVTERASGSRFGRAFFVFLGWAFVAAGFLSSIVLFVVDVFQESPHGAIASNKGPGLDGLFAAIGVVLLPVIFIFVVVAAIFARQRRNRQQALLWTLAVAAERSIPLPTAIEAFAEERSRLVRHEYRVLQRLLKAGTPLPQALSLVGDLVPEDAMTPIHVGQEFGMLTEGLRQATSPTTPYQAVWDQLTGKIVYLCLLCLLSALFVVFMVLKIIPKFQKIFSDFRTELPSISTLAMTLPQAFSPLIVLGCIFLFWLLVYVVLRYIGIITWDLPIMGLVMRKTHVARALESLAMAVERNQPLVKTVATLARCYPRRAIRRRLQLVLVDVASGRDFVESMRVWGLISRADAAVMSAATRVGNLAWAMREIADGHRRRLAARAQAWLQILFPAAVLCFGAVMGFLWIGYFVPLIALIQKLS